MRNSSLILFILIFTFLSVPAFAGQGALKLPEGSNASAIKHNKEMKTKNLTFLLALTFLFLFFPTR